MNHPARLLALPLLAVLAGGGCTTGRPEARLVVPPDLLRTPGYGPEGQPPRSMYVVRMTDGEHDWEFQVPEIATAYELKVPLKGQPKAAYQTDMASLTAADREIIEQRRADERGWSEKGGGDADDEGAGDGEPSTGRARRGRPTADESDDMAEGAGPARPTAGKKRPGKAPVAQTVSVKDRPKASYLMTLARVKELYRTRQYELAMVEIAELDRQYPDDERILAMKGSIYEKLGNVRLAREAWQQVLAINPYNLAVLEAVQRLPKN